MAGKGFGRLERLARLGAALREAKAVEEVNRARGDDPDHTARFTAHLTIVALMDFIDEMPGWEGLSSSLGRLNVALVNIIDGRPEGWLTPKRLAGAPPIAVEIPLFRARYAAVMDFLMEDGGWPEEKAARHIARRAGARAMELLRGRDGGADQPWKAVQDWRQEIIATNPRAPRKGQAPSKSAPRDAARRAAAKEGFGAAWCLIKQQGYGQSVERIETEANELVRAISAAF
jgi:hypothetical protein